MIGFLMIFLAVVAVIVMANWLRTGGGYDEKTIPSVGPEPPNWKPHEVEPWAEPKPYKAKHLGDE